MSALEPTGPPQRELPVASFNVTWVLEELVVRKVMPAPSVRAEARQLSRLYLRVLQEPPTRDVVDKWLMALLGAVSNAPEEKDHETRLQAVLFALADLPAAVWTAETCGEAMRTFRFWPSVADLDGLLRPHAHRLAARAGVLRMIATASPTSKTQGSP